MMGFFRRFMYGRYGVDSLNRFLLAVSFVCLLVWIPTHWAILSWIVLAILVLSYFRMFSRNIQARYAENQKFMQHWGPVKKSLSDAVFRFKDRKVHRYYKCPNCKTRLRVPAGRGKINIKCSNCGTQFVKKT